MRFSSQVDEGCRHHRNTAAAPTWASTSERRTSSGTSFFASRRSGPYFTKPKIYLKQLLERVQARGNASEQTHGEVRMMRVSPTTSAEETLQEGSQCR